MVQISIVIPTSNRPRHLGQCLAALSTCQEYVRLTSTEVSICQVIIIDDASRPPVHLPDELPFNIVLLRSETVLGPGRCRQIATAFAAGDAIGFLDDDAIPRADWLVVVSNALSESVPAITGRVLAWDTSLLAAARQVRYDQRYSSLSPGDPVRFFAGGNSAILTTAFARCGGFASMETGGDNSIVASLDALGMKVAFEPSLVVAHENGKGYAMAFVNAWRSGRATGGQPKLTSFRNAVPRLHAAAPIINRCLGLVHVISRRVAGGLLGRGT